jgi:hypothetical protein
MMNHYCFCCLQDMIAKAKDLHPKV